MTTNSPIVIKYGGEGDVLPEAVAVFKKAGVVAYPTETFYGLAVDPFNEEAIGKLFKIKGRSFSNPISLIVSDVEMLSTVVKNITPTAEKLMDGFWPGPLTIIFEAASRVPISLTAGSGRIGVRIPSNEVAVNFAKAVNSPITATSANLTGENPSIEAGEVLKSLRGSVDLIIDGGRTVGGNGSTVVDVNGEIKIIREGVIPSEDILKV